MARVMPSLAAQNTRHALQRTNQFLESLGRIKPSENDMAIYSWVRDLMKDG